MFTVELEENMFGKMLELLENEDECFGIRLKEYKMGNG